jgi:hypothetical protein
MTSQSLPTPGSSANLPSPELLGVPQTRLPDDAEVRQALDAGRPAEQVAAEHPAASLAWAVLAERSLGTAPDAGSGIGSAVEAYAYARTGYHRGLDQLRRNGWKGFGPVPWAHVPNQGFLRALGALHRAAAAIGEADEAQRTLDLLADSDPAAPAALGITAA